MTHETSRIAKWSQQDTHNLIALYTSDYWQNEFHNARRKHMLVWNRLAIQLEKVDVTGQKCKDKWHTLRKEYFKQRGKADGSGSSWPFFQAMSVFIEPGPTDLTTKNSTNPTINSVMTIKKEAGFLGPTDVTFVLDMNSMNQQSTSPSQVENAPQPTVSRQTNAKRRRKNDECRDPSSSLELTLLSFIQEQKQQSKHYLDLQRKIVDILESIQNSIVSSRPHIYDYSAQ